MLRRSATMQWPADRGHRRHRGQRSGYTQIVPRPPDAPPSPPIPSMLRPTGARWWRSRGLGIAVAAVLSLASAPLCLVAGLVASGHLRLRAAAAVPPNRIARTGRLNTRGRRQHLTPSSAELRRLCDTTLATADGVAKSVALLVDAEAPGVPSDALERTTILAISSALAEWVPFSGAMLVLGRHGLLLWNAGATPPATVVYHELVHLEEYGRDSLAQRVLLDSIQRADAASPYDERIARAAMESTLIIALAGRSKARVDSAAAAIEALIRTRRKTGTPARVGENRTLTVLGHAQFTTDRRRTAFIAAWQSPQSPTAGHASWEAEIRRLYRFELLANARANICHVPTPPRDAARDANTPRTTPGVGPHRPAWMGG